MSSSLEKDLREGGDRAGIADNRGSVQHAVIRHPRSDLAVNEYPKKVSVIGYLTCTWNVFPCTLGLYFNLFLSLCMVAVGRIR